MSPCGSITSDANAGTDSDDGLVDPSTLWAKLIHRSTGLNDPASSRPVDLNRAMGSKQEVNTLPIEDDSHEAAGLRRSPRRACQKSTRPLEDQALENPRTGGPIDDDDNERIRHRILANELFPPSPPKAVQDDEEPDFGAYDEKSVVSDSQGETSDSDGPRHVRSTTRGRLGQDAVDRDAARTKIRTSTREGGPSSARGCRPVDRDEDVVSDSEAEQDRFESSSRPRNVNPEWSANPRRDRSKPGTNPSSSETASSPRGLRARTLERPSRNEDSTLRTLTTTTNEGSDRTSGVRTSGAESEEVVLVATEPDDSVFPILDVDGRLLDDNDTRDVTDDGANDRPWTGGYGGMDDVFERDGVLIYEPTPKKRPKKLKVHDLVVPPVPRLPTSPDRWSSSPSSTPSRAKPTVLNSDKRPNPPGRIETTGRVNAFTPSGGRIRNAKQPTVEIDLTGSSSEDDRDEYLPEPPTLVGTRRTPYRPTSDSTPSTPPTTRHRKPPTTPTPRRSGKPSVTSNPRGTATPTSTAPERVLTASQRSTLPLDLIRTLDRLVFRKKWDGLTCLDREEGESRGEGLPNGIEVVWNARLRNTAGRAKWKTIKSPSKPPVHQTTIELATKVTDTESKLRHTLAHELCHVAAWTLSGEIKPPHGAAFKLWAARVMQIRPDIVVSTTHSYEIVYKYRWKCDSTRCGKIFGRHSNSINPSTHGCSCGGRLVAIDKDGNLKQSSAAPTTLVEGRDGTLIETPRQGKKKSPWLEFVAVQSPIVRTDHPGIPQTEVLKLVAERWKVAKLEDTATTTDHAPLDFGGGATPTDRDGLDEAMRRLRVE
ncbi:hypothetical protein JCM10212_000442 [Sporobolomyces blumeae]